MLVIEDFMISKAFVCCLSITSSDPLLGIDHSLPSTGEAFLVSNALANCVDDVTAHEHGTTEFKDRGEDYSVFNGQRAGPDRGGERIRDVVGTCR